MFVFVLSAFFVNCRNGDQKTRFPKRVISLKNLKIANPDSSQFTIVQVLKEFPKRADCSKNEKYANLYIGRKLSDGEIVYVFEECKEPIVFSKITNDSSIAVFNSRDAIKHNPDHTTVFVPNDFKLPPNAKYVFTELNQFAED